MDEVAIALGELPGALELAAESARLGDVNRIELWHARIEQMSEFLYGLCILLSENENADWTLRDMHVLLDETNRTYHHLDVLLFGNNEEQVRETQHQNLMRSEPNVNGRPRLQVTKEAMEREFDMFHSWKIVAHRLGVSEKTLRRRRVEFQMPISSQVGPRNSFSNISAEDLCNAVRDILLTMPEVGETLVIGGLRRRGIHVQRRRARAAIMEVDPFGRLLRRTMTVARRTYSVASPNALWYVVGVMNCTTGSFDKMA